jgi:hypothetical protein
VKIGRHKESTGGATIREGERKKNVETSRVPQRRG